MHFYLSVHISIDFKHFFKAVDHDTRELNQILVTFQYRRCTRNISLSLKYVYKTLTQVNSLCHMLIICSPMYSRKLLSIIEKMPKINPGIKVTRTISCLVTHETVHLQMSMISFLQSLRYFQSNSWYYLTSWNPSNNSKFEQLQSQQKKNTTKQ